MPGQSRSTKNSRLRTNVYRTGPVRLRRQFPQHRIRLQRADAVRLPLYGESIPRTADARFRSFFRESRRRAWGGDLVFFHDNSNPGGYVYHVGIYEGGGDVVSAVSTGSGIRWQNIWSSDVTFGTITH